MLPPGLRMVEITPARHAIRPAGLPIQPSENYKKLALSGGSGLHTDHKDPIRKSGLLMYYACFISPDVSGVDHHKMLLYFKTI